MKHSKHLPVLLFAFVCWAAAAVSAQTAQPVQLAGAPVVESVSGNSATIAWSTNTGGSSVVKYGTSPQSLNQTAQSPYATGGNTHRVELKNLSPNTTYYYQVTSGQGQGTGTTAQSPVEQFTTASSGGGNKVPLYRGVSASTGSHIFTTSYQELNNAATSGGFKNEGIAGYIQSSQAPGTQPFYRLFNPQTSDHFYTANPTERNSALSSGYQDEGVAGYISSTQQPGTVPLYRLRNGKGEHFYTAVAQERQSDLQTGWSDEGIAGYVWQQ